MRPVSLFVGVLVVASAVGCRDTPVDPIRQTTVRTLASVEGPVFCLTSPGVTQQSDGAIITVTGTDGWDAVNCSVASLPVIIDGLGGDDWLVGSPYDDIVRGGDGCDRVAGGPGNDLVDGGPGNDAGAESGGCFIPGGDRFRGPAGGGIFGTGGDDLLLGGPGHDGFNGGDGFDVCEPGPGTFTVNTCEVVRLEPVDDTPPVITASISGTLGDNDWYTSPVSVAFTVTDNESAIASTTGCGTQNFSGDTPSGSAACSATSAGGTSNKTVTFKIDQTVPTVTYANNAGTYNLTDNVAITCSAADAMSGVASTACANVSGMAYTFGAGSHTYSATATDKAGNVASGSTSFTVVVTYDGLCPLVQHLVSHAGIANSLCAKLRNAEAAAARGQLGAKTNILNAFRNEVSAQSGKAIAAPHAAALVIFVDLL